MSTINRGVMRVVGNIGGNAGTMGHDHIEAASQTFKAGEIVVSDGAGGIKIAQVTGTVLLDVDKVLAAGGAEKIVGLALADASGVTGAAVPVQYIRVGDIIECNFVQGTTTPGAAHTSAADELMDSVSLLHDTTSGAMRWFATTDVTEPCAKIIKGGIGGGRGVWTDIDIRVHIVLNPGMLLTSPYMDLT